MAEKMTMLTPIKQAYNDWCDQWEKGLGEVESLQKQVLENTYSAIEKLAATEAALSLKPVQLNALGESYTQIPQDLAGTAQAVQRVDERR